MIVTLPCGCRTQVTHHSGDRLVMCLGDGGCGGHHRYVLTAIQTTTYQVDTYPKAAA